VNREHDTSHARCANWPGERGNRDNGGDTSVLGWIIIGVTPTPSWFVFFLRFWRMFLARLASLFVSLVDKYLRQQLLYERPTDELPRPVNVKARG
jgi:hypothetical protein